MATASAAPHQPSNSRKPVEFDPCAEVGDQPVATLGFDPSTRERSDFISDHCAYLGCSFSRRQMVLGHNSTVGHLTIRTTNITLDEVRARGYRDARETTVSGRPAITYRTIDRDSCGTAITGPPEAVIDILVGGTIDWVGCDHLEEAVRVIMDSLPK